jgi:hypothetical protein
MRVFETQHLATCTGQFVFTRNELTRKMHVRQEYVFHDFVGMPDAGIEILFPFHVAIDL